VESESQLPCTGFKWQNFVDHQSEILWEVEEPERLGNGLSHCEGRWSVVWCEVVVGDQSKRREEQGAECIH
jgi:hypothetical protein